MIVPPLAVFKENGDKREWKALFLDNRRERYLYRFADNPLFNTCIR